jgi:N-acetylmuramoyl-L-alanine amidase
MADLRVSGWGPFRMPGEKARLRRIEENVAKFMASPAAAPPGHSQPAGEKRPAVAEPPTDLGSPDRAEVPGRKWRLGERKLFFTGQEGPDVAHLQQKLSVFGFLPKASVTGRFDDETKEALRDFQHRFGIYVDGVAGSVTAMVLQFLSKIDYQPDLIPVPDDTLALIQRVARSQRLGIALIGAAVTATPENTGRAAERLEIIKSVSLQLVSALNDHPILQGAEFPEGYTAERAAQLADSINAELVIYLNVLDDPGTRLGVATYFFKTNTADSAIGAPLARCIHDELRQVDGVDDRGCNGEDSQLLQAPKAPTVRIELGNLSHPIDRARLQDPQHIQDLADAITRGISRLYGLELPGPAALSAR